MNFIISIIMFVILGITAILSGNLFTGDPAKACLGFGIAFLAIAFIFTLVFVFQTMALIGCQRQQISQFFLIKKKIEIAQKLLEDTRAEFKDYFTKLYPEYEKEVFSKMSPDDAKTLSVYMTKYPELKFNGVLESFATRIAERMRLVYDLQTQLNEIAKTIKDTNQSSWFLIRVSVPQEINDCLLN